MKKISFRIERKIIDALAHVAQTHMSKKIGDALFDTWFYEVCSELLLKLATYRNRKSKFVKISFSLEQCLVIRELHELHTALFPQSLETLLVREYFANGLYSQ